MSLGAEPVTEESIRADFEHSLRAAIFRGRLPPSCQSYDGYVKRALWAIAQSRSLDSGVTPELVDDAWNQLEGMFDGTNLAQRSAEFAKMTAGCWDS